MMYLLVTCAQVFTLIDREAKNTLAENNEKLLGLFPNKITTKHPKMEQIMEKFDNVSLVYVQKGDIKTVFISELTTIQKRLLEITHSNSLMYSSNYVLKKLEESAITTDIS